jgi:hypothetical protein
VCTWPSVYVYVDKDKGAGTQTGIDWSNAVLRIEDALAIAASYPNIEEIWVAEGEYTLPVGSLRGESYQLISNIMLMGGFNGVVHNISDRTPFTTTVMSGDIGVGNDASDNCYHVITVAAGVTGAVLDGFTISDGNANATDPDDRGAGILNEGALTIRNCIINDCMATNPGQTVHSKGSGQITLKGSTILEN